MEKSRGRYKTRQRDVILSFLAKNTEHHITVEMIAMHLKGQAGQTTIYRNLDNLVEEGLVLKYEAPCGLGACYRHIGSECEGNAFYHFLCVGCGQMLHLHCNRLNDLAAHVRSDHGVSLDRKKTVLYGACERCAALRQPAAPDAAIE